MHSTIDKILAKEIKDSRGNGTIEVEVSSGQFSGSFAVPSGASTGRHEAHELRDADGKGVTTVIKNINELIAPKLVGKNIFNQLEIDNILLSLDGTPNKDKLGGNALIGVSIACAKTASRVAGREVYEYLRTLADIKPSRQIPYLFMNLVEGGKHADNGLAFQEYHIVPMVDSVEEALQIGKSINETLKEIIISDLGSDSTKLGDEGGFAPMVRDIEKPLVYLTQAIVENNLKSKVKLAMDVAGSAFFENEKYLVDGNSLSKEDLLSIYKSLVEEFDILSIEDPFHEEDFESFKYLKEHYQDLLVVGDDLTVSNQELLQKAIDAGSVSALIIKPNQIGTLSETLATMKLARENNIDIIVSHRSGETLDDFIADLAYAFGCYGLKAGAPTKEERMVKYKRLVEIAKN